MFPPRTSPLAGLRPVLSGILTIFVGLMALPRPAAAQETQPGGQILDSRVQVNFHPLGMTMNVRYVLEVDPGTETIPITAPVLDDGIRYRVEAIVDARRVDVTLEGEGTSRRGTVHLPEGFQPGGSVDLQMRYDGTANAGEDRFVTARVPVVRVPWRDRGPIVGSAVARIQLAAGFTLVESAPEGFSRETTVEGRLRYQRVGDTLPEVISLRAQEPDFGREPEGAVGMPMLLGAVLLAGVLAWAVIRRRTGATGRPG